MKFLTIFSIILFSSFFEVNTTNAQNADTLLKFMDNIISAPSDKEATVIITLINKAGKQKIREALMLQKGTDKKLYRYTQPESQAGISTLSLPDNIMWLYLPSFGKPTKISLLSKSQAFTGTDFSYEDMENKSYAQRYSPSILEANNPDYYLLKLTPKTKKSKYSHINLFLNKTDFYPIKMEYYDNRGNKFKIATYKYLKQNNYWYAEEVIMTDLKKEHSTNIFMNNLKFDQGISDTLFTVKNLKQ